MGLTNRKGSTGGNSACELYFLSVIVVGGRKMLASSFEGSTGRNNGRKAHHQ